MKRVTFNPGPSQLLPGVVDDLADLAASGVLSDSHRSESFHELLAGTRDAIRRLLALPDGFAILFAGSATELMEAAVRNLSRRRTGHLIAGAFSRRFRDVAAACGRETTAAERAAGVGFDLADTPPADVELLCLTHVETATGVETDLTDLAAWRTARPDALVVVDVVSSIPTRAMPWDAADAWLFSVQKGFGLPSGLGVLIVGERALSRSRELGEAGADRGWLRRLDVAARRAERDETIETPNVLGIALLGRACCRLSEAGGIASLERETASKAQALATWLDGETEARAFVRVPRHRARTVVTVELPGGTDVHALRERVARSGLVLGAGYGELRDTQVRIANFPAHSAADHARLTQAVDAALVAVR